jgi:dienelactone hydrolase
MNIKMVLLMIACFWSCAIPKNAYLIVSQSVTLVDTARNRKIPIEIYSNANPKINNHQLVVLSTGYGSSNTEYSYIAKSLINLGYLVVCVQHEQPNDPPIPSGENIYKLRMPTWERGVKNVEFVISAMKQQFQSIDNQQVILIGHSNGGDISMLFATLYPQKVSKVITLDHRRMPIPKVSKPQILSFRADEFEADNSVLPDSATQKMYNIQIINLKNTKHDDLRDIGNQELKQLITNKIIQFLNLPNY